jgi:hypothetical protein
MQPATVRVVFENQPYLVTRREDGSLASAFGPFAPGTEPNFVECGPENEVRAPDVLASLESLVPISPTLPPNEDTLAGSL